MKFRSVQIECESHSIRAYVYTPVPVPTPPYPQPCPRPSTRRPSAVFPQRRDACTTLYRRWLRFCKLDGSWHRGYGAYARGIPICDKEQFTVAIPPKTINPLLLPSFLSISSLARSSGNSSSLSHTFSPQHPFL
jgi:hypothetical protein